LYTQPLFIALLLYQKERKSKNERAIAHFKNERGGGGVSPLCPFFTSIEPPKTVAVRESKVAVVYVDGSRQGS